MIYSTSFQKKTVDELKNLAPQVDAIIVLGAAMYASGPSPMLKDRLDVAIMLYQQGISDRIIVSGDHGQREYDEVTGMQTYLLHANIPIEDIFLDHAGLNTYSSLYRAKAIFSVQTAVISTQDFHLARAIYIANRLGMDVLGAISDQQRYPGILKNHVRELLARMKAIMMVEILHSKPKYLGDPIDLSGSGLQTVDVNSNK